MSDQPQLPFDQPRKRRLRVTKQLPPKRPPPIRVRAWRATRYWFYATWRLVRWALNHAGEIKAALILGTVLLGIGGAAYYEVEFAGMQLRLSPSAFKPILLPPAPTLTGWGAEVKPG